MNSPEEISIVICHCAAKESLEDLIKDAIRKAINYLMEISVLVYRPPKHYKGEKTRIKYWSKEDTFNYLNSIMRRDEINVLLASDPVIEIMKDSSEEIPTKSLGLDPIGCVHNLDKHLEDFFQGIGVTFDKVLFWEVILDALKKDPSLDESGPYRWQQLYRSIYGDLSPESCLSEEHFKENFLVLKVGQISF